MISTKKEIITHFDDLIHRVDIDTEECLEKYSEKQVLGDLKCFKSFKKNEMKTKKVRNQVNSFESFELNQSSMKKSYEMECSWLNQVKRIDWLLFKSRINENSDELEYREIYKTVDLWSEETKVVDYLNQIRTRTIEELRRAQEEALEIYKSQQIYNKFYFQVLYTQTEPYEWVFKLFTFVTDFYMSSADISLLEKLINAEEDDYYLFVRNSETIFFNEKTILIGLLQKHFFENLKSEKFPSHVISVSKQDLLYIRQIRCFYYTSEVNLTYSTSTDLSNLDGFGIRTTLGRVNLDGFRSLESLFLSLNSFECISLKNLPLLRHLEFELRYSNQINNQINSNIQFLDYLPTIEYLTLKGVLADFNLESLVKLKNLSLIGLIDKQFNFDLFKNRLCFQLEQIWINAPNLEDKCLSHMFFGCHFPILKSLLICASDYIENIEKKLFDGFPTLQALTISNHIRLGTIDQDAFSNLKQLIYLNLRDNCIQSFCKMHFSALEKLKYLRLSKNKLQRIEENLFSSLSNLKALDLSFNNLKVLNADLFSSLKNLKFLDLKKNELREFDLRILDYIKQIELIDLSGNQIGNKEEILNQTKESNIKFVF